MTREEITKELLFESERRLRDVFSAVNDGIIVIDPDEGSIADVNDRVLEMLGYGREEIIGVGIEEIHPADMEQLRLTVKEVLSGDPVLTDEFSCLRKDGRRLPADISFSPVHLNGKTYVMAMVRDITYRKLAERRLKDAFNEIESLKNRLQAENIYLQEEIKVQHNFEEIISRSETLNKVLQKVEQVASTDASVLILGETGTGKELFARAIHNISERRGRPLVKVNCAAIPANLVESELFGYEKGAFTGALARKIGRFELADGGTVFLDEIGDLSPGLQAKLLRVLQEGEFERLGSHDVTRVDVRVIAATHRDLETSIQEGGFREDLYYRLNVFPIGLPPLRERKDDIPLLAMHFIKKYGSKTGKTIETVPQRVMDVLMDYHWPGNVRELENVMERAVVISRGRQLELGDWLPVKTCRAVPAKFLTLAEIERRHITEALEICGWRVSGEKGAARILGLKPTTLEAKMKKLGIERSK